MADPKDLALYMNLKPEPDTKSDREEANVTRFTGRVSYEGEHTIIEGKNHVLDLPSKESYAYRIIKNQGGSMLSQLKQSIEDMDGGPWTANGRDGKLTIKNRNYNQRPIASFTYAGGHGELISFTAKTTRTEKTLDTTESEDIDPDDKTLNGTQAQGISDETSNPQLSPNSVPEFTNVGGRLFFNRAKGYANPEGVDARGVASWMSDPSRGKPQPKEKKITRIKAYNDAGVKSLKKDMNDNFKATEEQVNEYMSKLKAEHSDLLGRVKEGDTSAMVELLSKTTLPKFTTKRKAWVIKWVDPKDLSKYDTYPEGRATSGQTGFGQSGGANYDPIHRYKEGYRLLEKGQLPNMKMIPKAQAVKWDGKGRKPEYTLWDRVQVASYEEIEVPIDGARLITSARPPSPTNSIVKSIQEEITGTFRIMGHPEIESEKIMTVNNVSKRYSGDWYITNIKHRIDGSGYHCDGQAIKKGSTIVTNVVSSSTNLNSLYAKINGLAEARAERNSAGVTIKSAFKESVEKYREAEKSEGREVSPDASFQLVVDKKTYDKWGNYNPKKGKAVTPAMPVYRAQQDVVNMDKERPKLKAEAEELQKKKQ